MLEYLIKAISGDLRILLWVTSVIRFVYAGSNSVVTEPGFALKTAASSYSASLADNLVGAALRRRTTPTPTPRLTATPTSTPSTTHTSTPTSTPTPLASCVLVVSPVAGATVSGSSVAIVTQDSCAGNWFESLFVDGTHFSDFVTGQVIFNSTSVPNGTHLIQVTSQSQNPGSTQLGSATVVLNVQNLSPSPTPTPVPFFGATASGIVYPSDPLCAAEIVPTVETVTNFPNNTNCSGAVSSLTTSNAPFNAGVPSASELSSYAVNGYTLDLYPSDTQFARVNGQYPAILGSTPSTDMILRDAACKFGLDEDVIRADAMQESGWIQGGAGDLRYGSASCVQGSFTTLFDLPITEPDGNVIPAIPNGCCQSWSLLQTKAFYEWMTWPMIMRDTSFATEYFGAAIRTCMDGGYVNYMGGTTSQYWTDYTNYLSNPSGFNASVPNVFGGTDQSLQPTNQNRMLWGCVGTHYAGYDWYDAVSNPYISDVQQHLHARDWP